MLGNLLNSQSSTTPSRADSDSANDQDRDRANGHLARDEPARAKSESPDVEFVESRMSSSTPMPTSSRRQTKSVSRSPTKQSTTPRRPISPPKPNAAISPHLLPHAGSSSSSSTSLHPSSPQRISSTAATFSPSASTSQPNSTTRPRPSGQLPPASSGLTTLPASETLPSSSAIGGMISSQEDSTGVISQDRDQNIDVDVEMEMGDEEGTVLGASGDEAEVDEEIEGDGEGEGDDSESGEDDGEGDGEGDGEEEDGDGDGEEGDEEEGDSEDEDSEEEEGDDDEDIELVGVRAADGKGDVQPLEAVVVKTEPGTNGATLPTDGVQEGDGEQLNVLVPKKKVKRRREMSTDDDLPPPPPPMKTIRLEHALLPDKEGDTLEWNILEDAQQRGMVEVWVPPEERKKAKVPVEAGDAAEVLGDGFAGVREGNILSGLFGGDDISPEEMARRLEEKYELPAKKKKKVKTKEDDYDLSDMFIDDSEVLVDNPTHVARPVKEGFFVHQGALEVIQELINRTLAEKTAKRSGAKKPKNLNSSVLPPPLTSLAVATTARLEANKTNRAGGTQENPMVLDGDNEAGPSSPVKQRVKTSPEAPRQPLSLLPVPIDRSIYKNASKDPRFLPPFPTFPPDVRDRLLELRLQSEKHTWSTDSKGKFPEHIKPYVAKAAIAAIHNEMFHERDEEKPFFAALPSTLPYNQFTLTKLATRLVHNEYWQFLQECENTGMERFGEMVKEVQADRMRKYEEAVAKYQEDKAAWDKNPQAAMVQDAPPPPSPDPEAEVPSSSSGPKGPTEPKKQFAWTAQMRETFAQLIDNLQDMVDLNKKVVEWNLPTNHNSNKDKEWTEPNMKSRLYKRIIDQFPEGYCTPTTVSRQFTSAKGKKKTQQDVV